MNLYDQFCSLDLAKRLEELGVKQESLFYWLNVEHCIHMKVKEDGYSLQEDEDGNPIIDKIDYRTELGNPAVYNIDKENYWSAFTVAELGEMLPMFSTDYNQLKIVKVSGGWRVGYYSDRTFEKEFIEKILANAMAKMLIYLIENKLIEVPK